MPHSPSLISLLLHIYFTLRPFSEDATADLKLHIETANHTLLGEKIFKMKHYTVYSSNLKKTGPSGKPPRMSSDFNQNYCYLVLYFLHLEVKASLDNTQHV